MTARARLVDEVRAAGTQDAVAEVVERWLRDPQLSEALGAFDASEPLHRDDDLTIVKVVVLPHYAFYPHEHRMWAVVATVRGQEENVFYERADGGLERVGGRVFSEGDVGVLAEDVIHTVTNPLPVYTVGLHVYGGDLLAAGASEWDPQTYAERPYTFEAEDARKAAWRATLDAEGGGA
ncbi:MAG TPA: hypothetical protein VM938_15150 [Acidimicrobiales bacterium]|nr:hypothetical protein [Acidimicrobiales bacterium]